MAPLSQEKEPPANSGRFSDASRPDIERKATALLKEIRKRHAVGHPLINAREVQRWKLEGMREANSLRTVMDYLYEAGWLMLKLHPTEVDRSDYHRGRQRGDWWVNPVLWSV